MSQLFARPNTTVESSSKASETVEFCACCNTPYVKTGVCNRQRADSATGFVDSSSTATAHASAITADQNPASAASFGSTTVLKIVALNTVHVTSLRCSSCSRIMSGWRCTPARENVVQSPHVSATVLSASNCPVVVHFSGRALILIFLVERIADKSRACSTRRVCSAVVAVCSKRGKTS